MENIEFNLKNKFITLTLSFLFVSLIFSGFAFAAHTAITTISPTITQGDSAEIFTIGLTNDSESANNIDEIQIDIPSSYSSLTCGAAPSDWSLNNSGLAQCVYTTSTALAPNNSVNFTLDATTASTSGNYNFSTTTEDDASVADSTSLTSEVDATNPSINVADIVGTTVHSADDTIEITFSEDVSADDGVWSSNEFSQISTSSILNMTLDNASFSYVTNTLTITLDYLTDNMYLVNGETINVTPSTNAIKDSVGNYISDSEIVGTTTISGDTTQSTITNVTSQTDNGDYNAGEVIDIQVVFDEVVEVTGTPQLTLETGDTDSVVDYTSGSGTDTLVFEYTVTEGDTSSDLEYVNTSSLSLNLGTIKDLAGNSATLTLPTIGESNSLSDNKALVIDTIAPTISEITAVTTPTNDTTPNYTFNTGEAGDLSLTGCSSSTTTVSSGDNTITFNTLTDGTYNCSLTVIDAAGNESNILNMTEFVVDATDPTYEISYSNSGPVKSGDTVTITSNFNEDVKDSVIPKIALAQDSGSTAVELTAINMTKVDSNTYTYDWTVSTGDGNLIPEVTLAEDLAGNLITNTGSTRTEIEVDNTNPTVSEITPVTTPTNDTTPNYTFTTNEAGDLSLTGCSSSTTTVISGNNTITFNTLTDGTYNCSLTVTDSAGNESSSLTITEFVIDTISPTFDIGQDLNTDSSFTRDATATDDSSGVSTYLWEQIGGNSEITFSSTDIANPTISADENGTYTIQLTVTDNAGNSASDTFELTWNDKILNLTTGWNLISTPKFLYLEDSMFLDEEPLMIYTYDANSGYVQSTLEDLTPVEALYIKEDGSNQLALVYNDSQGLPLQDSKELFTGWNLISVNQEDSAYDLISAPLILGNDLGITQMIYNNQTIGVNNISDQLVDPLEGYWVNMNTNTVFTLNLVGDPIPE